MINVAHFRTAVDATEGNVIAMPKLQLAALLEELETGQKARRVLAAVRAATAETCGVPA